MDSSIDLSEAFLRRRGFACEREPPWILEGKRRDFFAAGERPFGQK